MRRATWNAKMVRVKTMAVVRPAARSTASASYLMLTIPRVTPSATVKEASSRKLIGKLLHRNLGEDW